MTVYALFGNGDVRNAKMLNASLDDLDGDSEFTGVFAPPIPDGMEAVFDWIMENEKPFTLYYEEGQNPPKVFRDSDHVTVKKVRKPVKSALDAADTLLFLWDKEDDDDQLDFIFDNRDEPMPILELNNGLTPIGATPEDMPTPMPAEDYIAATEKLDEAEEDDAESPSFSREELETMPLPLIQRYAKLTGIDTEGYDKEALIDVICGGTPDNQDDDAYDPLVDEHDTGALPEPEKPAKAKKERKLEAVPDLPEEPEATVSELPGPRTVTDILHELADHSRGMMDLFDELALTFKE